MRSVAGGAARPIGRHVYHAAAALQPHPAMVAPAISDESQSQEGRDTQMDQKRSSLIRLAVAAISALAVVALEVGTAFAGGRIP